MKREIEESLRFLNINRRKGIEDYIRSLEARIINYSTVVIELINNEPNSFIGFDIEEIYNQALTDKESE
jgi:hypothetical protein